MITFKGNMKNLLIIAIGLFIISSCGDDKEEANVFADGVFVVNQGAFQTGTGTVSFYSEKMDSLTNNVYSTVNEGLNLGNIAQSMIEHDGKKYIAVNNAGKIVVAQDEDMTAVATIEGISQARYFASNGDRLFVSSWGVTGSDGAVYEINTSDYTLSDPIISGGGPEGMVISNGFLYVAQSGGFGIDNKIDIIDLGDNSLVKSLDVADKPQFLAVDDNDDIFVICNGKTDFYDSSLNTPGAIVKISNQSISKEYERPTGSQFLALDQDSDLLFYISGGVLKSFDVSSEVESSISVNASVIYGLHFDNVTDRIYLCDAKDFNSQGDLIILNDDYTLDKKVTVGIIPSFIHID